MTSGFGEHAVINTTVAAQTSVLSFIPYLNYVTINLYLPNNQILQGTILMSQVTIYHNPRCSKSRQTLELLKQNDVEPKVVEYLKTPPNAAELKDILEKLGLSADQLMRKKEDVYKELGLAGINNEDELITAMVNNPKLIERPIVIRGNKAAIGRPPEAVLDIL